MLKGSGISALSIKSIELTKKAEEIRSETKIHQSSLLNEFSYEDFIRVWQLFLTQTSIKNNSMLVSILEKSVNLNGNLISIEVNSEVSKAEILDKKAEILNFIHHQLQNYSIDLEVVVNRNIKINIVTEKTNKEKYLDLLSINPLLGELQKVFQLDYE